MLVLAIDSAGSACAVCVWKDGKSIASAKEQMERGQDARLIPMIMGVLTQAGCDFAELDRIAVTRGPGSFTGVRVALAAARGLGLAAKKPVIGIDRFSLYATHFAYEKKECLVVINSKRTELFCKYFPASEEAHDACLMTQAQIDLFVKEHPGLLVVGDLIMPEVDLMDTCAALAAKAECDNSDFQPLPLYLRAPDVTLAGANSR